MNDVTADKTLVWPALLAAVTLVGSYGLACIFPFAAVAALAALTLDWRKGALLVGAVWLGNQVVGFALLNYPHEAQAYVWGVAILAAALAAFGVAKLGADKTADLLSWRTPAALLAALLAAVATYQGLMFVWAVLLDGLASSTAEIAAQVALNDALWFAGLALFKLGLDRSGLITARPAQLLN